MSEEDISKIKKDSKRLKIENLIFRLNQLGLEKQAKFDDLWELERKAEDVRVQLIKLIDNGLGNVYL